MHEHKYISYEYINGRGNGFSLLVVSYP